VDFKVSSQEESLREEVQAFVADNVSSELLWNERDAYSDTMWPSMLQARENFAKLGWAIAHWPSEYGGQGADAITQMVIREEMARLGVPETIHYDDGPNLIGPAIIRFGSDQLKQEHLPLIGRGQTFWCQGYTEPGGGSDLASVRTTATKDGGQYVINGQKDYVGGGARANWIHILARTNTEAARHSDITCFLVDMQSPGITLRALDEAHGRSGMLNEVFFDEARVPVGNVVGQVDGGWQVVTSILNRQRTGIHNIGRAKALLNDLVRYTKEGPYYGNTLNDRGRVKQKLGQMAADIETCRLAVYRVAWMEEQGLETIYQSSMSKLLSSEMWQRFVNAASDLLGLYGPLDETSGCAPLQGRIAEAYAGSVAETIILGTSEIQRNIIAQKGLGMPRK
jgi:alkylation response protein AidB-like acyl-CoA dehydrogenase